MKFTNKLMLSLVKNPPNATAIASMDKCGYVREAAIIRLANQFNHSDILPYILIRLNDWVPEVRETAEHILAKIMLNLPISVYIQHYRWIYWLSTARRINLLAIQNKIYALLREPKNYQAILTMLDKLTDKERLFCLKNLLYDKIQNDDALLYRTLIDPCLEIREWLAKNLSINDKWPEIIRLLCADKAKRVRYAALKAIPEESLIIFEHCFELAIFDPSHVIRSFSRFILKKLGNIASIDLYREAYHVGDRLQQSAIIGLAEVGNDLDIQMIMPYINHENPTIRTAILASLTRTSKQPPLFFHIAGLTDSSAKVRKICVAMLIRNQTLYQIEAWNQLTAMMNEGSLFAQKSALKVLVRYPMQESLLSILSALLSPHPSLHLVAWAYFLRWHNKYNCRLYSAISKIFSKEVMEMYATINSSHIIIPLYAQKAWGDLPNIIMSLLKLE